MQPCAILELDATRCHWPLGEFEKPATEFCGGTPATGHRYCPHHLRLAHGSTASPKSVLSSPSCRFLSNTVTPCCFTDRTHDVGVITIVQPKRGSGFLVPFYLKRKGLTETSGVLSVVCFTLNSISFSALVSKTVTDSIPLQVTSRVALSFDFMSIVSPNL
jgi:GcrA cell cycle regulator